jgi:DNA-binding NarL/FixJ family response regulator
MDLARAVAYALEGPGVEAEPSALVTTNPLTRREHEVAHLLRRGLTNRQIASELVIAEGTVGIHVDHILAKLGFHSRAQVAAWVAQEGLTPDDQPSGR